MTRTVTLLVVLCLLPASAGAQDSRPTSQPTSRPAQPAKEKKKPAAMPALGAPAGVYGEGVKLSKRIPLETLAKKVARLHGAPVRFDGLISDVCRKKGCWMVVKDGAKEVRVRFKDYGFFVPRDASGRRMIVEGIATEKTISAAEAKHYAEESGDPESAKAIKGPQKVLAFTATGVEILGSSTCPPTATPAPESQAVRQLLGRLKSATVVTTLPQGKEGWTLPSALVALRRAPAARTAEFSLCTELKGSSGHWLVFSAGTPAFSHGFALNAKTGELLRF